MDAASSLTSIHPRYELREHLGAGGMSDVFKAWDLVEKRWVAIKRTSRGQADVSSFLREFEILYNLRHPHLPTAYDLYYTKDSVFFSMDWVDGRDLASRLRSENEMTADLFFTVFFQVLSALQYCHNHGIVHYDLKPENIILRNDPTSAVSVRLIDFGLAQWEHENRNDSPKGTIQYASPEMIKKEKTDRRSDLYALGVILYEMAAGLNPFDDGHIVNVVVHHLEKKIDSLNSGFTFVTDDLKKIILKLLVKDPQFRYQNVEEIYRDLRPLKDLFAPMEPDDRLILHSCFVQRENEIGSLTSMVSSFISNPQSVPDRAVWIAGENGAGKTALLRRFKLELHKTGIPALLSLFRPSGAHENLKNFLQMLFFDPHNRSAVIPDRLRRWIEGSPNDFLDDPDDLISELAAILENVWPPEPRVFLMDDWENLNDFEKTFFERLIGAIRHNPSRRSLLFITCELKENSYVTLENFDREGTGLLIRSLLNDASVNNEIIDALYSSTNGNPFLIETTLNHLIGEEGLINRNAEWKLNTDRITEIPSSINDFIEAKLRGLDTETASVLASASVFPFTFSVEAYNVVSPGTNNFQRLSRLKRVGLIEETASGYVISNNYLREKIYQALPQSVAEENHRKLAAFYESQDKTNYRELAFHYFHSDDKSLAVPYLLELSRHQIKNFLPKEALDNLSRAASVLRGRNTGLLLDTLFQMEGLLDRLGRRKEQESVIAEILDTAGSGSDFSNLLHGILRKANYLEKTSQFEESQRVCEEGLRISREKAGGLFAGPLYRQLGRNYYNRALWKEALGHYETAYAHAIRSSDRKLEVECLNSLGTAYGSLGDYERAKEYFAKTVELSEKLGDTERKTNAVFNLARLAYKTNDLDEAMTQGRRAEEILKELKNRKLEQMVGQLTALIAYGMHHYEQAFALNEKVMSLSEELNDPAALGRALANQALVCMRLGLNKMARNNLDRSLDLAVRLDNKKDLYNRQLYLAEWYLGENQWEKAWACIDESMTYFLKNRNDELLHYAKLTALRVGLASNFKQRSLTDIERMTGPLADLVTSADASLTSSLQIYGSYLSSVAFRLTGRLDKAIESSTHAVQGLQQQKYYEFGSAEIYYHHYQTMLGAHASRAELGQFLEKAYNHVKNTESRLKRSDFRTGYVNLPVNREIVNEYKLFFSEEREFDIQSFQILYEITKDINSILESEKLFDRIMDSAIENTKSDRGLILIKSDSSDTFEVKVARNVDQETLSDLTHISQSIVHEVYQTGQSIVTADANLDDRFRERKSIVAYHIRSIMCVPLRIKEAIIGAVYIDKQFDTHYFSPRNLKFLESFANIAGIAIENARLYEKLNLEKEDLSKENIELKFEIQEKYQKYHLVGRSKPMTQVFRIIEAAAGNTSNVLIQGESGTGKELVAKAIHYNGNRKNKKFVAVDCGALPENLLESELFGYKKGAFTGASTDKKGLFEEADGGTIFLDEITNTSLNFQSRLLRVLQESEIRRVGDNETRKINVRVIAATNRNLLEQVQNGAFREDLYYRINVIVAHLPPLRDRKEDIPLLVQHIIEKLNRSQGKHVRSLSSDLMEWLVQYDWPGNVRQLENILSRMMLFAEQDTLSAKDLPEEIKGPRKDGSATVRVSSDKRTLDAFETELMEQERSYFRSVLESVEGNKSKAAEKLGIKRTTLNDRLKKLGL